MGNHSPTSRGPIVGRFAPVLVACALIPCISWQFGLIPLGNRPIHAGTDVLVFYTAGQLVRQGRPAAMYDRAVVTDTARHIMEQAGIAGDARYLPWMYPPFFALPFALLAKLPYRAAATVWLLVNIGLMGVALSLLRGMMPARLSLPQTLLICVAICLSMPFLQAMYTQQNTFVSLVLLCLVARFWLGGRGFAAGACAGLMLFKPQLAVVITVVLGISMGAEAIAGFAAVAAGLVVVTLVALPGTIAAYLHYLPATAYWLEMELPFNWGRQITLQGFWRLMIQGHAVGPTATTAKVLAAACAAALGVPLAIAAWRSRGAGQSVRSRLIAAAIVATPLMAPYCMDYDLLLLAVAAGLTVAEKPPQSGGLMEKTILGGWIVVAGALYLNPFVAATGRCNVAVLAIAGMAILLIHDAFGHLPRVTAADRPFRAAPMSALSR
ncbi:MAG TPA: glycosyltransferase family 87 protein [Tepidisphaeraceae bacterium]|jgi:hypothetical protein|nr:glycosyltransferase family 87 protein [Tepidisphaeraceae bacterium]